MSYQNRCPNCHSIAHHELTTIDGDRIYHCTRLIYDVQVETRKGEVRFNPNSYPCDTYIKEDKEITGYVAFVTDRGGRTQKVRSVNLQPKRA